MTYGDPRTTPGGKGKNFSYFTRVEVVRDGWIERPNKVKVGQTIKARTMKNKTAPPARVASPTSTSMTTSPSPSRQYDTVAEVWNIATTYDIIERQRCLVPLRGPEVERQGRRAAGMREDLDLQRDIDAQVRHFVLGSHCRRHPASVAVQGVKQWEKQEAAVATAPWRDAATEEAARVGDVATTCARPASCGR